VSMGCGRVNCFLVLACSREQRTGFGKVMSVLLFRVQQLIARDPEYAVSRRDFCVQGSHCVEEVGHAGYVRLPLYTEAFA